MADLPLKYILQSDALSDYILKTSAYPKEHQQLRKLRETTAEKYGFKRIMNVPVDEAQFLSMLLKLMNAKKTLELGVFTGYSLLATALALPEDGKVTAIDTDKEAFETGLPFIKNAGVDHKVDFIQSDVNSALDDLISNGKDQLGSFDFAFVDADKDNYINYHEALLKLVRVGGIIAYDNTLWFGSVALRDDDPMPETIKKFRGPVMKLNCFLANDPRIQSTILPIGDGVTLCRRL